MRFLVLLAAVFCVEAKRSYEGYHVLTVGPFSRQEDLNAITDWASSFSRTRQVVFLRDPPQSFDIAVDSALMPQFEQLARSIPYQIITTNLQEWIDEEARVNEEQKAAEKDGLPMAAPERYLQYAEVAAWVDQKASQHANARSEDIPTQTHEGRTMKALKIGPNDGVKPKIWMDCGIHSREWISPSTCLWVSNKILTDTSADAAFMRDRFDWIFVPVANPDGYQYSHDNDRLWRKNTRPQDTDPMCLGCDTNRNWDSDWGGEGTDPDPCGDLWAGDTVWSEPSVRALRDYIIANRQNIQVFITAHSFTQLWLVPYSYTFDDPANDAEIRDVGNSTVIAIESVNGRPFTVGSPPELIYAVGGSSMDWAKMPIGSGQNIRFAYAPELRPQDILEGGFILPPVPHIRESGEEIFAGLAAKCRRIADML